MGAGDVLRVMGDEGGGTKDERRGMGTVFDPHSFLTAQKRTVSSRPRKNAFGEPANLVVIVGVYRVEWFCALTRRYGGNLI